MTDVNIKADKLLTDKEAAAYLGVARQTVAAAPTIVVRAHGDGGAHECYSNKRSGRCILILNHLRTIKSLYAPSIQFFQNILLEYWILVLQVCPTERRFIDRLWIIVERFPRSGACAQGTRNE
ncbi:MULTISPECIES: hypothetical protein [Agrobacterium tumefaciens complex]|uniref:Uncharacterized protein n=1 Tax=Agrobacterium tomkonis CFBP 6623 TaxID=1183432 RepID=A0A1S7QD99_9HYPH|nr:MULTISPECIES: hypothetical protein [Agrobacterium tumefaciens complex]CUX35104.1 hypothetical protein AGR3A_Cc420261 [Agrobacterium tomkonis CFBP 6623]